jgi:hypothetical protein
LPASIDNYAVALNEQSVEQEKRERLHATGLSVARKHMLVQLKKEKFVSLYLAWVHLIPRFNLLL